jgi:hypothetical protein
VYLLMNCVLNKCHYLSPGTRVLSVSGNRGRPDPALLVSEDEGGFAALGRVGPSQPTRFHFGETPFVSVILSA